ncbi:MAG TPA: hypothetical protein DEH78_05525 [Solibacterales bacterium]|nr:hypothetical protein [Bryobacterales bacterium]
MQFWASPAATACFALAAAAVCLYALHRLALWLEDKGWIFYARRRARPDALGNALVNLHELVKPEVRHTVQARRPRKNVPPSSDPDRTDGSGGLAPQRQP